MDECATAARSGFRMPTTPICGSITTSGAASTQCGVYTDGQRLSGSVASGSGAEIGNCVLILRSKISTTFASSEWTRSRLSDTDTATLVA